MQSTCWYQVFYGQGSILHERLHEPHQALHHEAPVVADRIPTQQEIGDVNQLVHEDGQLRPREISFQLEKRPDHPGSDCSARVGRRVFAVVWVVVASAVEHVLQRFYHLPESFARTCGTHTVPGVRYGRAQEHQPISCLGLAPPLHRVERDLHARVLEHDNPKKEKLPSMFILGYPTEFVCMEDYLFIILQNPKTATTCLQSKLQS